MPVDTTGSGALQGLCVTNSGRKEETRWPGSPCSLSLLPKRSGRRAAGPGHTSLHSSSWAPAFIGPRAGPGPLLRQFGVRPLPRLEVVLQVWEADRGEVGPEPPADPPLACGGVPASGAAELVPVVLSPGPTCEGRPQVRQPVLLPAERPLLGVAHGPGPGTAGAQVTSAEGSSSPESAGPADRPQLGGAPSTGHLHRHVAGVPSWLQVPLEEGPERLQCTGVLCRRGDLPGGRPVLERVEGQ